ncbi:hypothetical protein GBA52_014491 [Prunus armeniaca]|nr:hypothetical protein GBA52_014491 [Prunus armeniaca]
MKPGKRPPGQAQSSSSAREEAWAIDGSHLPGQAQGQVSFGLQLEGTDVMLTSSRCNQIFFTVGA